MVSATMLLPPLMLVPDEDVVALATIVDPPATLMVLFEATAHFGAAIRVPAESDTPVLLADRAIMQAGTVDEDSDAIEITDTV